MNGMSLATKGTTNTVARTMPGTAKTIFTSCAASHGPSQPCAPNRRTGHHPGDHRRDAEREIDERDEHALAGVAEAGDGPGRREAEQRVQRLAIAAHQPAPPASRPRARRGPRAPSTRGARLPPTAPAEDRRGGHEHEARDEQERDGHEGPPHGGRVLGGAARTRRRRRGWARRPVGTRALAGAGAALGLPHRLVERARAPIMPHAGPVQGLEPVDRDEQDERGAEQFIASAAAPA